MAGAWRFLPYEFPPWQTAANYFRLWRRTGLWQRAPGGPARAVALVSAYLPDLATLDPGLIDPAGVAFLALTPALWIAREQARLAADPGATAALRAHLGALGLPGAPRPEDGLPWTITELPALLAQAIHAVAYPERRATRPLVSAPPFAVQLFLAALERGILTLAHQSNPGGRLPADRTLGALVLEARELLLAAQEGRHGDGSAPPADPRRPQKQAGGVDLTLVAEPGLMR